MIADVGDARATLRFYGESVDLISRKSPEAGRIYVTLDGQSVPGLARDASGKSVVDLSDSQERWQVEIPLVQNVSRGEHKLDLIAEGKINLDGFTVAPLDIQQPPWFLIGALTLIGGASGFLFVKLWRSSLD